MLLSLFAFAAFVFGVALSVESKVLRLFDSFFALVPFFLRAEALPSCRSAEMVVADEECSYRRTKRNDCEET